jgi:hypothetical protein
LSAGALPRYDGVSVARIMGASVALGSKLRCLCIVGGSPEHFSKIWHSDEEFWREVVIKANVTVE